ncbi:hypothetical protein ABZ297_14420 [Nonomuraea sp. NPDC005983]|uniref:hypothetical protein n=1 Tax=Nonomuraea sp. NPDC005983 TaxID=3155595 RepID=UPI00339F0E1C
MGTQRAGIGRITAALVAVASMLPYLTLKVLWLTGHPIGVTDPNVMNDPTMVGMNAMTFGMDVVGFVLAVAFTSQWGMRLPSWLVLLPLWVGTGLLGVVVATMPIALLVEGISMFATGGPIEPWVYMMVYGGFIGQGVGLMAAFVLYARDRWPVAFTTALGHPFVSRTRAFQTVVARGALLVGAVIGATRLYWAFGGTAGLPTEAVGKASFIGAFQDGFKGLAVIVGAIALIVLVRARGRRPFWQPLIVAWFASGSMFGWGLYAMILVAVGGPLGPVRGTVTLVELFTLLTGLVMGMSGAFLLTERSRVGDVQAVQEPLEGEDREGDRQAAYHGHR